MEKGRLANLIAIAERVYHLHRTFIGSTVDVAVFVFDGANALGLLNCLYSCAKVTWFPSGSWS